MSERFLRNSSWAIAVVHGVGTPHQGETAREVCRAVREATPDFQPEDPDTRSAAAEEGPTVQRWRFAGGGRARVAEAFWGDLSLVRGTVPDMVLALCYNLYGAVHISRRTLDGTSRLTRFLPIIPFYLVRWIVLPLHILALGLALPMALLLLLSPNPEGPFSGDFLTSNDRAFLLLVALYVIVGLAITVWLIRRQRSRVRPQPWDFAAAFTLFALFSAPFGTNLLASWFQNCKNTIGGGARGVKGVIADIVSGRFDLPKSVCDVIIANTPIEEQGITGIGRYIAVNELAGDVAFYLCAVIVLIYSALAAARWVLNGWKAAHAMLLVAAICCLVVVTSAILLEIADFLTRVVQFWGGTYFRAYWYEVIFVVWVIIVAAGAAAAIVSRRRKSGAKFDYSRVIVSEIFQLSVIGATLLLILLFIGSDYIRQNHPKLYDLRASYLLVAPAALALFVGVLIVSKHLRLGLDIAMDVVNHFVASRNDFPIRRAISRRFHDVLDHLTKDGDRPHLLIVAHSQGSVIAVDALAKDIWNKPFVEGGRPLNECVSSMTILTFGSPLTHIYQHYFPNDYGPFSQTSLAQLAGDDRVRWVNIYREDDPVGTWIEGPHKEFPENVSMPEGGHVRYWEKEIFASRSVCQHLPGGGAT